VAPTSSSSASTSGRCSSRRQDARGRLWTSRVWPGALLVDGTIAGTWRRAEAAVSIETWRRLSGAERHAVEAEVAALPLPGTVGESAAHWLM
jgi:hypothetical protein